MKNYTIIGIDEAGRGPLAGPVAVGVAMVSADFDWGLIPGVNDSKKLSEKNREVIFLAAKALKKEGKLNFAVSMVSASVIDKIGIVPAVNLAMNRALKNIEKRMKKRARENSTIYRTKNSGLSISGDLNREQSTSRSDLLVEDCVVKLDGGLKAPERFMHQETIIKGDQKEKVIGLASIMAKVTRDRYMRRAATLSAFAAYDLATHKGYGTKTHREAIQKFGLSDQHRRSFCTNIISQK